jgi:hypothetical protein
MVVGKIIIKIMIQYFSYTNAEKIAVRQNSTSAIDEGKQDYEFNRDPVIYNKPSPEEKISKEDEVKFYKKVFETKNI